MIYSGFRLAIMALTLAVVGPQLYGAASSEIEEEKSAKLSLAEELAALDEPFESLNIIAELMAKNPNLSKEEETRAISVAIFSAAKIREMPLLESLYSRYPELFQKEETILLELASYLIAQGQIPRAKELFSKIPPIQKKESQKWASYRLIEADLLLADGKKEEALSLLQEPFSEREKEIERLLRLSLLERYHSPKNSWQYLQEAVSLDKNNPLVRMQRAFFLENIGKPDYAEKEYAALIDKSIEGKVAREKLAGLIFTKPLHDEAVLLLPKILNQNPTPEVVEKALFFEKAISPITFHFTKDEIPQGPLHDYLLYLSSLPENRFWDELAFRKTAPADPLPVSSWWLPTLEKIRIGDQKGAQLALAAFPEEAKEINPTLYRDLQKGLTAQMEKGKSVDKPGLIALFSDHGWYESALLIAGDLQAFSSGPEVNLLIATALFHNRGLRESIEFIEREGKSPQEKMQLAELYIQNQEESKAVPLLEEQLARENEFQDKAAKRLAAIYLNQKEVEKAASLVQKSKPLQKDIPLQEKIAREALSQKKEALVHDIYIKIQADSDLAASYLVKEAYMKRDFKEAYAITKKLLEKNPTSKTLQDNLKKIEQQLAPSSSNAKQ